MWSFRSFLLALSGWMWLAPMPADARQVALVVGNARYVSLDPLKNPKRDAAAIADRLRDLAFDVHEVFDGDAFALQRAAERFIAAARGADLALFYFAGHGIQLFDRNILLSGDADPFTATRIDTLGLDLTDFLARLRAAAPVRSAVLIDACRDNPMSFDETVALLRRVAPVAGSETIAAARSVRSGGLAQTAIPQAGSPAGQTLMFFAAQPGNVSYDGDGQNSYFVEGLKEALARADRPLTEMLQQASAYVRTVTGGRQVPQVVSDWTSDIVIGRTETAKVRYLNHSGEGGRELSEADVRRIGEAQRSFQALSGTFIVRESQSFIDSWIADEQAAKASRALGMINGFAIDYDLDRDGRPETIGVYFRQTNVILSLTTESVTTLATPCWGDDEVETVEIGLRDINGDRRPEIFLHVKTRQEVWGTFCILEYAGTRGLAASRRGPGGERYDDGHLLRLLLRQTTAQARIGEDNTIETCDGSNCHTRSVIRFDGSHFRMTLDESDPPAGARAQPFRDEADRKRLGAVVPVASADAGRPTPPPELKSPAPLAGGTIEQRIAAFVVGSYLRDGNEGTTTTRFADVVQYYGRAKRRDEVLVEKRAYYARWTVRRYALVAGTIDIKPAAAAGSHDVSFDYEFALARANGAPSQGRGRARLTLRPDAGSFVVSREEGEVVSRR